MIRDTLDLANLLERALRTETAGEAVGKNVRELSTVPVAHRMEVETVEGLAFSVQFMPAPFPLVPVSREGPAEHIRNALEILKRSGGSPHPSATDAVQGAIARLELALTDLEGK